MTLNDQERAELEWLRSGRPFHVHTDGIKKVYCTSPYCVNLTLEGQRDA